MYKIKDESIRDLESAFELLNHIETKGLQNHINIANIASLLQRFREDMVRIEDKVKASKLPISEKKEKEKK